MIAWLRAKLIWSAARIYGYTYLRPKSRVHLTVILGVPHFGTEVKNSSRRRNPRPSLAGARLALADVNAAGLTETRDLIEADGGVAVEHLVDVTARPAIDALAEGTMAKFGRLGIWVNSAGVIVTTPIVDATEEQIDRVIATNLKGVYAGCAAAGRVMQRARRRSIVNLSSGGGEAAVAGLSVYSMSKAAVNLAADTSTARAASVATPACQMERKTWAPHTPQRARAGRSRFRAAVVVR